MSDSRKELETVLWAGADVLRSKMDANEYKDYLLRSSHKITHTGCVQRICML